MDELKQQMIEAAKRQMDAYATQPPFTVVHNLDTPNHQPTERDTHFANAAGLLMSDLNTKGFDKGGYRSGEEKQRVIANFLFDFADHLIKHLHGSNLNEIKDMGLARFLEEYGKQIGYERVPDMDTLPE